MYGSPSKKKRGNKIKSLRHCKNYCLSHIFYVLPIVLLAIYILYLLTNDYVTTIIGTYNHQNKQLVVLGDTKQRAPQSKYFQYPEGHKHVAAFAFKPSNIEEDKIGSTNNCIHSQPHFSNLNMVADSNGNLCPFLNISQINGCCDVNIATNKISHCNVGCHSYHQTQNGKSEDGCCEEYPQCVSCCMTQFHKKNRDTLFQKYKFKYCEYVCRHSSKSTINSKYYKQFSQIFCFGEQFLPPTEYASIALQYGVITLHMGNQGKNCFQTCQENNATCTDQLQTIFDTCEFHNQFARCIDCIPGPQAGFEHTFNDQSMTQEYSCIKLQSHTRQLISSCKSATPVSFTPLCVCKLLG